MTKKQANRLARNRNSQRAALREHFTAGQFGYSTQPAVPYYETIRSGEVPKGPIYDPSTRSTSIDLMAKYHAVNS